MAISHNPSKTLTIERMWVREINKRWRKFSKDVIAKLIEMNKQSIEVNAETHFSFDMSQVRVYMIFYQSKLDELLGAEPPANWMNSYQLMSYQRGLQRARQQLVSEGASLIPTFEEAQQAQTIGAFTATPSLGVGVVTQSMAPIHSEALEFLYGRSYESLKGWTDKLGIETRQILVSGIEEGKGIRELTKEIQERIGVSKSRAELISSTETIQAYQRSSTNEAKRASEELGEEVLMRWISANDSRVRNLHRHYHGTLVTPEENFKRINKSPWRCRCAQVPTIKEAITPAKQEKFKKQRDALIKSEENP